MHIANFFLKDRREACCEEAAACFVQPCSSQAPCSLMACSETKQRRRERRGMPRRGMPPSRETTMGLFSEGLLVPSDCTRKTPNAIIASSQTATKSPRQLPQYQSDRSTVRPPTQAIERRKMISTFITRRRYQKSPAHRHNACSYS